MLDGITFDSKHEAERYVELKYMERAGLIEKLELQTPFELVPKQYTKDGKTIKPVIYKADFTYWKNGCYVVEDAKGVRTQEYIIKKKMMRYFHGIEIQEV